eukprot:4845969-Prymnesium_polylepis.1
MVVGTPPRRCSALDRRARAQPAPRLNGTAAELCGGRGCRGGCPSYARTSPGLGAHASVTPTCSLTSPILAT